MKVSHFSWLLPTLMLVGGCERVFMRPAPKATPTAIFDEAWTFVSQEYSYFDYKGVDWDAAKATFGARVSDDISDDSLFNVIADMLYLLRDGHVNLRADFDRSRNWTWFLNYPPNFSYDLLERNYFKQQEEFAGPFIRYDFGDVGYLYYESFGSPVADADMLAALRKFAHHRGLIIDVRGNGGGALDNVFTIAQYFANAQTRVAGQHYRNGPGRTDFSPVEDVLLQPADTFWAKPVVVLTNRKCYSATTFLAQFMRELPNVTLLGDTTGGGGGAPSGTQLANGWEIRCSNTRTYSPQGQDIEHGVAPDTVVHLLKADADAGFDTLLEEALRRLRR